MIGISGHQTDNKNKIAWIHIITIYSELPDLRFSGITKDLDLFTRSDLRLSDLKNDSCTLSTAPLLEGGPISVFGSEEGVVVTHLVAALNIVTTTLRDCES